MNTLITRLLTALTSLRIGILLLTVPYAVVWSRAEGSGGFIFWLAYALAIQFVMLSLDGSLLERGVRPRLAIAHWMRSWSPALVRSAGGIAGLAAAVLGVLLLLGPAHNGLLFLLILALAAVMQILGNPDTRHRSRIHLSELVWPFGMLLAPLVLLEYALGPEQRYTMQTEAATLTGAIVLGVYVLLAELRDEADDRLDYLRTTVTVLGRELASIVLFIMLAGLAVMAIVGAVNGWWNLAAALVLGIAGLAVIRLADTNHIQHALKLWWLAGAIAAAIIAGSIPTADVAAIVEPPPAAADPSESVIPNPSQADPSQPGPSQQTESPADAQTDQQPGSATE